MGKRATLNLDTKNLEELITKLDELGGDIKAAVEDALIEGAALVTIDTQNALSDSNMPAGGKYSSGETRESVVKDLNVKWDGTQASIKVGFDYDKPGAGGYLITGTPHMRPNQALNEIYKGKKYMQGISKRMSEKVSEHIKKKMEG